MIARAITHGRRRAASRYTFYAVPFVGSVYLKLAQSTISSYCEKIQAGETVCRPAPASLEENPWSDFMSIVPAALFLALLLQGLMQYLMSLFNPTKRNIAVSYTVVPCIGVHLFTMVYYTMEMAEPCVLLSHYGLETRPIHCFMWICSISAQTITLYGLEIEVLAERDPLQGSASAKRIPLLPHASFVLHEPPPSHTSPGRPFRPASAATSPLAPGWARRLWPVVARGRS